MTYSEYRSQFKTVEEFRCAFGKLTEEEARALIAAENTSTTGKAAMMSTWRMAKKRFPMNHAHWIKNTHLFDPDDYECSACGAKTYNPYDRCPGCGREMCGAKDGSSWVDEAAFMDFITGGF